MDVIEQYFGCDVGCLNHIARMIYFPHEKDKKIEEEDNIIYFSAKTENHLNRIFPPFSIDLREWPHDFSNYFEFHILKRLPIASCYVLQKYYMKKDVIGDCFDFQNKDLPAMKNILSNLSTLETLADKGSSLTLDNERWFIRFSISQLDENMPYWLGWEIQFRPRNIWGRIGYALKYIFGNYSNEQDFEINKSDAEHLNGLISVVERLNDERTESKN